MVVPNNKILKEKCKTIMAMGDQFPTSQVQSAFIRFKNNTCFCVEIMWINSDNKEKPFGILAPNKFLDINTYAKHPWIFRECLSKSQMVVSGEEKFMARPWVEEHTRLKFQHPINIPLRTMVLIEMPVLDLQLLCLLNLAYKLKTKDDITMLNLPMVIKKELTQMILNKEASKIQVNNLKLF